MILVTGATGTIGSRLVDALLARGDDVRALSRRAHEDAPGVSWQVADLLDQEAVRRAFGGVRTAYYLAHALSSNGDFAAEERRAARTFASAARAAGVERVIYVGALAHGDRLSPHLESRHAVGELLREHGPPTIEFRASVVIGRGSASYELVRTLVERLPVVVLPTWAESRTQPIALDDVVAYLVAALDAPARDAVYEIGGPDAVTYRDLVHELSASLGRETGTATAPAAVARPLTSVLERIAPERARVWAKLVESLRFDSTLCDTRARDDFDVRPRALRDALAAAA